MDNTLKLILGVLGLSGLLIMLVPGRAPTSAQPTPAPAVATVQPPVIEAAPAESTEENEEEPVEDEDGTQLIKFGEPMMDGLPIDPANENNGGANNGSNNSSPDLPQQQQAAPNIAGLDPYAVPAPTTPSPVMPAQAITQQPLPYNPTQ